MTEGGAEALCVIFAQLDCAAQQNVVAFAEFLLAKQQTGKQHKLSADLVAAAFAAPLLIEPTPDESVVAALRRLTRSYNMLDSRALLAHAVDIMNGFVLQGRDRVVVILELEALFQREYDAAKKRYETSVAT